MAPTKNQFMRMLDLDETTYEARKVGILNRLRLRWTARQQLNSKNDNVRLEVARWIVPLVRGYLSENEMETGKTWLTNYTSWAIAINTWSRDDKRKSGLSLGHGSVDEVEWEDGTGIHNDAQPQEAMATRNHLIQSENLFSAITHQPENPYPERPAPQRKTMLAWFPQQMRRVQDLPIQPPLQSIGMTSKSPSIAPPLKRAQSGYLWLISRLKQTNNVTGKISHSTNS